MDWKDLLAIQGTLKSLLQHHSSKASILGYSAYFMVQLSHLYMTTGETIALTIGTFVSKVMSLLFNTLSRFVIAFLLKIRYVPASHRPVNTSRTNERMSQKLGGGLRPLVQLPSLKSSLLRTPVRSGIRATVAKGKDVFLTAALAGNSRFLKMRLPKKQESSRKTSILLY